MTVGTGGHLELIIHAGDTLPTPKVGVWVGNQKGWFGNYESETKNGMSWQPQKGMSRQLRMGLGGN